MYIYGERGWIQNHQINGIIRLSDGYDFFFKVRENMSMLFTKLNKYISVVCIPCHSLLSIILFRIIYREPEQISLHSITDSLYVVLDF